MAGLMHGQEPASAWVVRWSHLIPAQSAVLDVACGHGRHMRHLAALGHPMLGIDRNPEAIAAVSHWGSALCADIENEPWPLVGRVFGGVVVTHYLWRPLWPHLLNSLAKRGVLIYETFCAGHESVGKPSRPDFLLRTAELLNMCSSLRVVAFEEGFLPEPERFVQRIVAVRESAQDAAVPARYLLSSG